MAEAPVHRDDDRAAEWLGPILGRMGVPDEKSAAVITSGALLTTGAVRRAHGSTDWAPFMRRLCEAAAAAIGGAVDTDELEQALLENILRELHRHKQLRPEEAAGPSKSSKPTATTVLEPPTAESEERLRTVQWCREQPVIVSGFVRRVLPPPEGDTHPEVECKCGRTFSSKHFRSHIAGAAHEHEFFGLLERSEQIGAAAALQSVASMVGELQQRAVGEQLEADALRGEVSRVQAKLAQMEAELTVEKRASCFFENRYARAQGKLNAQDAKRSSFTSPTAALHQQVWEEGLFDAEKYPLNHTLDELHNHALVRVSAGDDVQKGGAGLHLSDTARALSMLMYNKSSASGYRLFRAVYRYPPHPSDVARLPPFEKGGPFVAIGCHQLEWGQQAFRFYEAAGYDPRTKPFGICWDPAKMKAEVTWDAKTNGARRNRFEPSGCVPGPERATTTLAGAPAGCPRQYPGYPCQHPGCPASALADPTSARLPVPNH